VEDCAAVSREVGHLLEVEDPIEQAYTLEVSSPGLDRPLRQERDFVRARGKKAKVVVREAVAGRHSFVGEIIAAGEGRVTMAAEEGRVEIPLALVKKARLLVEF
jgi:ribosome maturation factor RimP